LREKALFGELLLKILDRFLYLIILYDDLHILIPFLGEWFDTDGPTKPHDDGTANAALNRRTLYPTLAQVNHWQMVNRGNRLYSRPKKDAPSSPGSGAGPFQG
ncbi:MAG: hypothetical protein ACLFUE_01190, partial [Desulfobacteraceae bacterium]